MTKQSGAVSVALLLLCSLPLLAQKKVSPKAFRFQGAPQYTQQELLAAAGLRTDTRLNFREVKAWTIDSDESCRVGVALGFVVTKHLKLQSEDNPLGMLGRSSN
jgi:hypothetical protein